MTRKSGTITCSISGCSSHLLDRPLKVQWQGAQRDVLSGDINGHVDLEPLEGLSDLYGLGPLEGVRGEITILDSRPYVTRVQQDGSLMVENSFRNRACFLVYSQVQRWQKVALPEEIVDEKSLEHELPVLAAQYGLDPTLPFPFLLRGRPDRAVFHVLNKTDGLLHSPELHEKAKEKFTLEDAGVEIIGFHSHDHRGIFTPSHSAIHIHLKSEDGLVAGHVDTLSFPQGIELYLPAV